MPSCRYSIHWLPFSFFICGTSSPWWNAAGEPLAAIKLHDASRRAICSFSSVSNSAASSGPNSNASSGLVDKLRIGSNGVAAATPCGVPALATSPSALSFVNESSTRFNFTSTCEGVPVAAQSIDLGLTLLQFNQLAHQPLAILLLVRLNSDRRRGRLR